VLPKAILFDLDDTLISAYNRPDRAWLAIAHEFAAELHPIVPDEAAAAINHAADVFWADAERHRVGRLQLLDRACGVGPRRFDDRKHLCIVKCACE